MKKVITYGTFDLFHQGHYNIIKRAKDLGDYLIVGITSESFDIERGKLNVRDSLLKRIENVKATGLVDEIIIEEYEGQKVRDIIKYEVDVFVIGSDWRGKFDYLKEYCEVHYLERTKSISSTMLREQQHIYKMGVITDDVYDNELLTEVKYVSGVSVEKVFSEKSQIAEEFCQKYEMDSFTTDLSKFFEGIDIVYINVAYEKREFYAKAAIEQGKYIICTPPIVKDKDAMRRYVELAAKQKVIIIDNIVTSYLRAFTQLVWLLKGNLIGDVVRIRCCLSRNKFNPSGEMDDLLTYALFLVFRILGMDYEEISRNYVRDEEDNVLYKKMLIKYKNGFADIDISTLDDMKNGVTILGTKGRVEIPDDWWNMGYFRATYSSTKEKKRYSYNFEGNGLRYLVQEALIMINDNRKESTRVFADEVIKIAEILSK